MPPTIIPLQHSSTDWHVEKPTSVTKKETKYEKEGQGITWVGYQNPSHTCKNPLHNLRGLV